jgi:MoxR-like ATPase
MKLKVDYPSVSSMHTILNRTTQIEEPAPDRVLDGEQILEMRKVVLAVPIARPIQEYAVRIVLATHPDTPQSHAMTNRYVRYGASPRGAQALVLAGKIRALLKNRVHVSSEDIRAAALPVLRHRVLLNFEGEAEQVETDAVVGSILEDIPEPHG